MALNNSIIIGIGIGYVISVILIIEIWNGIKTFFKNISKKATEGRKMKLQEKENNQRAMQEFEEMKRKLAMYEGQQGYQQPSPQEDISNPLFNLGRNTIPLNQIPEPQQPSLPHMSLPRKEDFPSLSKPMGRPKGSKNKK